MLRSLLPVIVLAAGLSPTLPATADSLLIENLNDASSTLDQRPRRGMSMETVAAKWGEPQQRAPAVGDPPISRWDYEEFVVFFEHSRVIHAVQQNQG